MEVMKFRNQDHNLYHIYNIIGQESTLSITIHSYEALQRAMKGFCWFGISMDQNDISVK